MRPQGPRQILCSSVVVGESGPEQHAGQDVAFSVASNHSKVAGLFCELNIRVVVMSLVIPCLLHLGLAELAPVC